MRSKHSILLAGTFGLLLSAPAWSPARAGALPTLAIATPPAGKLTPELAATLGRAAPGAQVAVIISHPTQVDLNTLKAPGLGNRNQAHATVVQALKDHYNATLRPLEAELRRLGGTRFRRSTPATASQSPFPRRLSPRCSPMWRWA